MNPLQHMQLHESEFTKSEHIIKEYILSHLDVIASFPIQTVSEKCKTSKTALFRFCQKCGYRGYTEFKYDISRYLQSVVLVDNNKNDTISTLLTLYTEQIQSLNTMMYTKSMDHISKLIKQARKIKIYGIHETGLSCEYFSYRLCTLGIDSEPIVHSSVMAEKASMAKEDDLNIYISLSAETSIIIDSLQYSLKNHSKNILITQNDHHRYRNKLDEFLILPTFNYQEKNVFLDSQAMVFITIDLLINNLAKHLHID